MAVKICNIHIYNSSDIIDQIHKCDMLHANMDSLRNFYFYRTHNQFLSQK